MPDSFSPGLKKILLEVVENQLRADDPPETRQALERLLAAGYSRKVAKEMIGAAIAEEIWHVLNQRKPSDPKRLKALLDNLG